MDGWTDRTTGERLDRLTNQIAKQPPSHVKICQRAQGKERDRLGELLGPSSFLFR